VSKFLKYLFCVNIKESIKLKQKILKDDYFFRTLECSINQIVKCLQKGNKILLCGNGGSSTDAQHFVAELVGTLNIKNRKALPAISLSDNIATLTSISNDISFNKIFERNIQALGKPGDTLIAISTSGNSKNIIFALQAAKEQGIFTIGLLGKDGGRAVDNCDLSIIIPSKNTQRIQEMHIMILHFFAEQIEQRVN
jgi:D-sedoheptulose 7-phosphate isomerase